MARADVVIIVAALPWLGMATWQDLRTHEVSNWLTVPPLIAAVVWGLLHGDVVPATLLAAMLAVEVGIHNALTGVGIYSLVSVLVAVMTAKPLVPVTCATAYMALRLNLAGGADAKIAMTLITLFPDGRLAVMMLVALFVLSVAVAVAREQAGQWATLALRCTLALDFPTQKELTVHGVPLVGALAVAFAVWLIFR
jgi:hypothetical protein